MPASIVLEIIEGKLRGRQFPFDDRNTCLVGRGEDCQLQLPSDDDHRLVSRHHCLLDINPPDVRVRDFGSRNGTYVNGVKIGQRDAKQSADEAVGLTFPIHDLHAGDVIKLGKTVFRVNVHAAALCSRCRAEIPEKLLSDSSTDKGALLCRACQETGALTRAGTPTDHWCQCASCGKSVTREMGTLRPGDFLCAECQADPLALVEQIITRAKAGEEQFRAVDGYQIVRELGRGGMGAVFLARHQRTGDQVALKLMLPRVAASAKAQEMFLREAENTRALKHPNIVELLDSGFSNGTFFLTLEYCDGGSLVELVSRRGGTLSVEEAVPMILQVLTGLEYAHSAEVPNVKCADGTYGVGRGVVHRDIKPRNIFLSGTDTLREIKIGDYGLAKAFDSAGLSGCTVTGTIAGTSTFMPRQQLINFKYAKPEVDVWSTAATLYYLLTGATPRDFPPHADWCRVILETSALPVRQRRPALPVKLAEVIDQALVDKPAISFKSAAELRRALESAL
jgi:serine/threonine-protein kinase